MKTFLTIDLDYFGLTFDYISKEKKKQTIDFFSTLFNSPIPYSVIKYHHEILPELNKHKYDKIINIDFHNDVTIEDRQNQFINYKEERQILNEGTWGNFYKYRKNCIFEWRLPNKQRCLYKGAGICGFFGNYKLEWHPTKMGYKKVFYREGLDNLPISSILHIAYCISPNWYYKGNIEFLFKKFPQLNICKEEEFERKKIYT